MNSQSKQILEYLTMGGELTAIDALNMFGCFRLSARINDLRKHHHIKMEWVEKDGKRFSKYKLETDEQTGWLFE